MKKLLLPDKELQLRNRVMILHKVKTNLLKDNLLFRHSVLSILLLLIIAVSDSQAQTPTPTPVSETSRSNSQEQTSTSPQIRLSSSAFIDQSGLTVEKLIEIGANRRADLLAARQKLAIAEGRITQAGLRPNPILDAEFGSPKFLGGESEQDISIGITQVFETGGKKKKRVSVAQLELAQAKAEVLALERQFEAEIRASYVRSIAAGRQLDTLEKLITSNEELIRITEARLKEGDVAPLELNLVQVEINRLRVQVVAAKAALETELISLKTLAGMEQTEVLRIAPLPEHPPRFDLNLSDVTEIALRERQDLQAAKLGEELGDARIRLAQSQSTPNVSGSIVYKRNRQILDLPESLNVGPIPNTDNSLTFGISIDLPVFNRNQGEIVTVTAQKVQAQRQREFLETTIKRDVALAYRRYKAASEALVIYATQILPRAEDNLKSVRAAYNFGEFSVFDIINEQRRLIENETGYNEALRDYYAALAELETVLGISLPTYGFAPSTTSILPDENLFRFNKEAFLKAVTNEREKQMQTPLVTTTNKIGSKPN